MKKAFLVSLVAALALPTSVYAHVDGTAGGLWSGMAHPWFGLDHLLALVAMGILAARSGGRSSGLLPVGFVAMMVVGALLGMGGVMLLSVEFMIALSVVAAGLLVATQRRMPVPLLAFTAGLFALFHGHAHGTELPLSAQPALYVIGFALSSLSIQCLALVGGRYLARENTVFMRLCGIVIAALGVHFLVA